MNLNEESFLTAAIEARKAGPLVARCTSTSMLVKVHGCYDVHIVDWRLWRKASGLPYGGERGQ